MGRVHNEHYRTTERGATLVEAMIASAIFLSVAVAIYPVFFETSRANKFHDFKTMCMKAVKDKLALVKGGLGTNSMISDITTSNNLFISANIISTWQQQGQTSTGFASIKTGYNALLGPTGAGTARICYDDVTLAATPPKYPPNAIANLGYELFAIGNGASFAFNPAHCPNICGDIDSPCPCQTDQAFNEHFGKKFRLFLNLQRVHQMGVPGVDFGGDCPIDGSLGGGRVAYYDFDGATDAIKLTVTGVMDLSVAGARPQLAGFTSTSEGAAQLSCSASEVIKPPNHTVRYVIGKYVAPSTLPAPGFYANNWDFTADTCAMQQTGCDGAIMDMAGRPVFRSLWDAANRAIVVAPNNRSVYLLRGNTILRFGDESVQPTAGRTCIGAPAECTSDGTKTKANLLVPLTIFGGNNVNQLDIQSFGVTFQQVASDRATDNFAFQPVALYIHRAQQNATRIQYFTGLSGRVPAFPYATPDTPIVDTVDLINPPAWPNGFAAPPAATQLSFNSWFVNFQGTQAFVIANQCANGLQSGTTSFCKAIYRYQDLTDMDTAAPIDRLKLDIIGVSP